MVDEDKKVPGEAQGPDNMIIEFVEHNEGPHAVVPLESIGEASAAQEPRDGSASDNIRRLEESLVRQRADFENYRRRMERDQAEAGERAQGELIRSLLPVLDNLDTALGLLHAEAPPQWSRGLELCQQTFMETLAKAGALPIDALNKPFDPQFHEAVMLSKDTDIPHGTVTEIIQRGFLFKGKLLRPARVKVNRLDPTPQGEAPNG